MMRACHTIAFALVSWYLLIPPLGPHEPNLTAPLYEWFHEDPLRQRPEAYLTLTDCEARKAKKLKDPIVAERKDVPYLRNSRCVKSDDPRLIYLPICFFCSANFVVEEPLRAAPQTREARTE
jgi:hypothetical protein